MADKFVRVRITRIDNVDLNLFEFDYDLTFMVFFLNADEKVYARYGGRDASSPDKRQSLAGLRYTMKSVLDMHAQEEKVFVARTQQASKAPAGKGRGCMHCHQVRERFNADLKSNGKWTRDMIWRYPLPDNLGLELEVDRGNIVRQVKDKSPASLIGLKAGDMVQRLGGVPIHSFADAQFALDIAPTTGAIDIAWQRNGELLKDKLTLADGWRRTDLTWRPSMRRLIPSARLSGTDLKPAEKKALGLSPKQLAFRQKDPVSSQAKTAGIQPGDVIFGLDDKLLEMDSFDFLHHVQRHYLIGDRVTVNLIRDGKRMSVSMTLGR